MDFEALAMLNQSMSKVILTEDIISLFYFVRCISIATLTKIRHLISKIYWQDGTCFLFIYSNCAFFQEV